GSSQISEPLHWKMPGSVTAPKVRPVPSVSVRVTTSVVAEFATVTVRVYSIVEPGRTVEPFAGLEDFSTVTLVGVISCSVVQVVQTGSGSPPGGLVATTLLPTEPVAS